MAHSHTNTGSAPLDVLFVIGSLEVGGTETQLSQLLPKLGEEGIRPALLSLTGEGPLAEPLRKGGVEVLFGPRPFRFLTHLPRLLRGGVLYLHNVFHLAGLLRKRRPAVCHCFLPFTSAVGGLAAMLANYTPLVISRRSLNDYQAGHRLQTLLERFAMRRARMVLGNSRAVIAQLEAEGVPKEKLRLIYNGIDFARFDIADSSEAIRRAEGIPEDALVMISVANFIPYKGHEDLFMALRSVQAKLPEFWRLLCVGREEGAHFERLRTFAENALLGHVHFLGPRNDVPRLLKAADLAVLASHQEGFSNSLLEGMAAGLPTVATNVGGNPEAIEDGINGALVPPKAPDALATAMLALSRDHRLRHRYGEAARAHVERHYALPSCIRAYAALYRGLGEDA